MWVGKKDLMGLDGVLEQAEGMIRTNSESCEVQR